MKISKIIILFVISTVTLFAGNVEDLMKEGNQYYQAKEYDKAIEKYNEVLDNNYESQYLYYNLGNAYYRNGQIGYAILNYERGLKLNPDDEDLLYNLSIVKARTTDRIKEVPTLFIVKWWDSLISLFSATVWQILLIIFYLILVLSVTLFFITKSGTVQRVSVFTTIFSLAFAILLSIILYANVKRETSTEYGILIEHTISAKQSPNDSSNDLFVIHEGLKVSVLDQFGEWYKVKLSDGKVGWLPKSSLEII